MTKLKGFCCRVLPGYIWGRAAGLLLLCSFWIMIDASCGRALAAEPELLTPKTGGKIFARSMETHLVLRQAAR